MRLPFLKKSAPRWVDTDSLNWTPEQPFGDVEPRFAPGNDIGWTDDWRIEPAAASPKSDPRAEAPQPLPAPEPNPLQLVAAQRGAPAEPVTPPAPANLNRAPSLLLLRLGIGLAQGLLLFLLLQAREINVWPGSDPYLFSAFSLALVFAPLVLLEGLGDIEINLLALWSGTIAALLATLGLYRHWRMEGVEQLHADYVLLALVATALVIAQSLLRAGLREGKLIASYRSYFDTAWTLGARLLVWALLAGTAWALIGSGNSLYNWLRAHHPAMPLTLAPALVILPLLGLASAAVFDMTAGTSWTRRAMKAALLTCGTVALPMLAAAALALVIAHFVHAPVPLAQALGCGALLLFAFNASYRGEARARWRKAFEFAAAFLILALAILAAFALATRIATFGWTAERVLAAAAVSALGLYGALYSGAALMSLGGARWMQPVERINLGMACLLLIACCALASPLADPLPLAVKAQTARLADPAVFDFTWLARDGARFGHEALTRLARSTNPEIARDATLALAIPPGSETPPATEIGANITVRTPGARLPNSLLAQDWAGNAQVPPCLTKPRLACDAWFLDLDGDGVREILLVYGNDARWWASVMKQSVMKPEGAGWRVAATLASPQCRGSLSRMRAGGVGLADPTSVWRDVLVAGLRLTPTPAPRADLPCPN
jgi:hypothetical protein